MIIGKAYVDDKENTVDMARGKARIQMDDDE